jgi:hypothetical protein
MERARGSAMANSLSMYSITKNIYYSQLSSVAIFLQPEPNCFTSYNTRKGLCSLSLCTIVLLSPPPSHMSTSNGQRSSQLFCVHYSTVQLAHELYAIALAYIQRTFRPIYLLSLCVRSENLTVRM